MTEKKKKFIIPTHIKQTRASYLQVSEHGMLEFVDFLNFSGHCPLEMQTWSE